jgi:pyruvate kinase
VSFDTSGVDTVQANVEIIEELQRRGAVRRDDLVIITKGDFNGVSGGTNVMKIVRVGEHVLPD